jgi:hypothetical protein
MSLLLTQNGIATGFTFWSNYLHILKEKQALKLIKQGNFNFVLRGFTDINLIKEIQNYLVHLIITYIPKQFQITLEVANHIQNNWNNYSIVISNLIKIVHTIMIYKVGMGRFNRGIKND